MGGGRGLMVQNLRYIAFTRRAGWEGESMVGIFVRVIVESHGLLVTCSVGSPEARAMDV